jgi:iron complex outermembrane receptor protein
MYDDGLQDTILRREGADYRISTGTVQVRFGDSLSGGGRLLAVVTDADRGSPGAVTSSTPSTGARLADRQASALVSLQRRAGDAAEFRLRSSYLWNRQEYTDPGIRLEGVPLHSVHRTTHLLVAPEVLVEPDASFRLTAGAELGRSGIASTDVPDEERLQASLYAGTAHRFSFTASPVNDLSLYPSVRVDAYSDNSPEVQPHLGINVGLSEDPVLRVRGAVSGNSRIPTFNELYWQPGGNPDLRPERSLSAEAGVVFAVEALGVWDARVTLYSVSTTDRIVWLPGDRGIWSPRNLRSVRTEGVETELSWSAAGGWIRFSASGAWLAARRTSEDFPGDPTAGNEIPFTPGQIISGAGICTAGPFTISATYSWVGERYADEGNTRLLPSYGTADASLRCDAVLLAASWFLQAEVFNILDTPYEILPLYPMPMREFHATIGVRL